MLETITSNGLAQIIPSCTGVLISQNLLLTVAHNVGYISHAKFIDSDLQEIFIELKDYINLTSELDEHFALCLVKLPSLAPINYHPVKLLDKDFEIQIGTIIHAAGFGIDGDNKEGKCQIRTFELPLYNYWSNHLKGKHTEDQRCSFGDSGGPAYLCINESLFLAGVTTGTDVNNEFTYFIRPNLFKDWIFSTAMELKAILPIFVNPNAPDFR